jgi:hypothetical protein
MAALAVPSAVVSARQALKGADPSMISEVVRRRNEAVEAIMEDAE